MLRPVAAMTSGSSDEVRRALIASGIVRMSDPVALSRWCSELNPVRFPAEHVIASGGDDGGRLYVIMSGRVKTSIIRPDRTELLVAVLGSYEIFGVVSLFEPVAPETRITALTDVVALPIERAQLLDWMTECPELGIQTLRLFARRTREMTDVLTEFASADVQGRVSSRLSLLKRRFGRREGDVVRIVHEMSMQEFSLLVGVSPAVVRNTLRDFENQGWIRLDGEGVVVVDSHALPKSRERL
jgi:CRP/FNR family transcriptional regulator, cyclic AMP receptor protein